MTSMDPGPSKVPLNRKCLFATSVSPLERCRENAVKNKIYCSQHIGKKPHRDN